MKHKLFTKNFTLLILGQASSLFGNYILRLALSMYVLDATGSATVFAGILSLAVVPSILLSPLGGILADRADKRKVMAALFECFIKLEYHPIDDDQNILFLCGRSSAWMQNIPGRIRL